MVLTGQPQSPPVILTQPQRRRISLHNIKVVIVLQDRGVVSHQQRDSSLRSE